MYRSFTIKNFRCFDELTVEGMGRINLIAGKNNVGKTALLEALWVHHGAVNPNLGLMADAFRGLHQNALENFLGNLFHGFDRGLTIELAGKGDWGDSPRWLKMWFEDSPTVQFPISGLESNHPDSKQNSLLVIDPDKVVVMDYSCEPEGKIITKGRLVKRLTERDVVEMTYEKGQPLQGRPPAAFLYARRPGIVGEDINRYSRLEINGQEDGVLRILQEIEPSLKRLSVISTDEKVTSIYADIGLGRLLPVQLMGEGMSRIFSLALAIASCPGGIVLIDEIENGLHYTVMEKVWRAIGAFARYYDVQLFATTHSRECVYYAHRAFEADEEEEMRFFRIDRARGKLRAVMYDKEMREAAFEVGVGIR